MFNWYRLFNYDEFLSTSLVSKTITVALEDIGEVPVLIVQGNVTSIVYDDVMLSISLNEKNPFRYGNYAVFLDDNNDVWLGIYNAD
jgi:hypothetical protein